MRPRKSLPHLPVPGAGFEPARGFPLGILSPLRLPIPPPGPELKIPARISGGEGRDARLE